jgi:hypothetical protein
VSYHTETNLEKLEHRVGALERYHAEKLAALGRFDERDKAQAEQLRKVEEVLMELRDRVMSIRICPAPGTCVTLEHQLVDIRKAVNELKTDRAVVVEGWKLVGIVAGGIIAVGTAAYAVWRFIESIIHRNQ